MKYEQIILIALGFCLFIVACPMDDDMHGEAIPDQVACSEEAGSTDHAEEAAAKRSNLGDDEETADNCLPAEEDNATMDKH